jgi:hypothetical protein
MLVESRDETPFEDVRHDDRRDPPPKTPHVPPGHQTTCFTSACPVKRIKKRKLPFYS